MSRWWLAALLPFLLGATLVSCLPDGPSVRSDIRPGRFDRNVNRTPASSCASDLAVLRTYADLYYSLDLIVPGGSIPDAVSRPAGTHWTYTAIGQAWVADWFPLGAIASTFVTGGADSTARAIWVTAYGQVGDCRPAPTNTEPCHYLSIEPGFPGMTYRVRSGWRRGTQACENRWENVPVQCEFFGGAIDPAMCWLPAMLAVSYEGSMP